MHAESPLPLVPARPDRPGIFGIGFTNVTGTSARLVFTTSEPMRSEVAISGDGGERMLKQDALEEIHAVEIGGLAKGVSYRLQISGVTNEGRVVATEGVALKSEPRVASTHKWPGWTIFGTSISGDKAAGWPIAEQAGVRMVRLEFSWYGVLPNGRAVDHAYLDDLLMQVAELKKRQIEPLVILDYCVPWAKPYTNTTMTWRHPSFGPPDRLDDWEYYVRTVVEALHGDARYFEIWNEPDAGYLGTGSYVERPGLPPPIGREPFKDNWNYWLGDRYAPMIASVRKVMDELQPNAILLNGGWNRDYTGMRGDLLFQRGMAPYLDAYAFHTYSATPVSFSSWYQAIDGGFRHNIDRIFLKHQVRMPLAVTEWGWPAWSKPNPEKGFVSFRDAQIFYLKSAFYFLSLQRVELLSQFELGIGPDSRDKDPLFFMLVNRDDQGDLVFQPTFQTFSWLASTFGSRPYRALPVKVSPTENVKAYAIELGETGEIYVAAWQDGKPGEKGAIAALPPIKVELSVPDILSGKYSVEHLDLTGKVLSEDVISPADALKQEILLPEVSSKVESEPVLLKFSPR
ncbi:hypothetical protein BH09VER1_BH09VER1_47070 [soil metagenome]